MKKALVLTSILAICAPERAIAQTTDYCLPMGTNGAVGCQSPTAPTLTSGIVATGDIDFLYDAGTAELTLVVTNTSPIVVGETSPVITRIAWNVPAGVSGLSLTSQTGSGGATPAFALQFAPNSLMLGCLGSFDAELSVLGVQRGIGNAAATVFAHPLVVLGPATFVLQVSGTGLGALTAASFALERSLPPPQAIAVGMHFQGAGVAGADSGFVSNGAPCCPNQAAVVPIGTGCAPSGFAIPTIDSIATPGIGVAVGVDFSSPSTPGSFALVLFGFSSSFSPTLGVPLPLDLSIVGLPGCSLYTSAEIVSGLLLDGSGAGSFSFVVPGVTTKWCGAEFTYQSFVLASGGDILGTAGLTLILGS